MGLWPQSTSAYEAVLAHWAAVFYWAPAGPAKTKITAQKRKKKKQKYTSLALAIRMNIKRSQPFAGAILKSAPIQLLVGSTPKNNKTSRNGEVRRLTFDCLTCRNGRFGTSCCARRRVCCLEDCSTSSGFSQAESAAPILSHVA